MMMRTGFSNLHDDEEAIQNRHAQALIDICKGVFAQAIVLGSRYAKACERDILLSQDIQLALKYCTMYRVGKGIDLPTDDDDDDEDDDEDDIDIDADDELIWTEYVGDDPLMNAVTRAGREFEDWTPTNPAQEYLKSTIDANEFIVVDSEEEDEEDTAT